MSLNPLKSISDLIFQRILIGVIIFLLSIIGYQYWSFTKEKDHYQDLLTIEKDKVTRLTEVTSNIRSDFQKTINDKNRIETELKKLGDVVSDYLYKEHLKRDNDIEAYKDYILVDKLPMNIISDKNETNTTAESIKNIDSLHKMYKKVGGK